MAKTLKIRCFQWVSHFLFYYTLLNFVININEYGVQSGVNLKYDGVNKNIDRTPYNISV
jgi:hypothetical protein